MTTFYYEATTPDGPVAGTVEARSFDEATAKAEAKELHDNPELVMRDMEIRPAQLAQSC